ncbi:MAG: hypothetical protein FJ253_00595, partial [Phycisphaerae bacterium]|nr:hypothetical protein [Phycisphaerae bacterium]
MFGSAALDTAIGLITIFLMLSLVCSALNEMLASVTNRRGKFLRLGIARMLGDDEPTDRTSVTADFFRDRRIASLSRGRRLPSYIPPSTFGAVAADLASGSTALSGGARVRNVLTIARATGPQDGNPVVRQLLRDAVESASALPPRLLDEPPAAAMARIEAALGRAFDDTMNRASGWYRRNTQGWLFVIALIVVWAINADTLTIVRHLAVDEKTRTALADIGANQAREPVDPGTGDAGSEATNLNAAEREAKLAEAYAKRAKHILESTRGLALPLGWTWSEACAVYASSAWYSKTFGLLITAIAVALGAPFWFDVLQKLASLRSTG